MKLLEGKKVSEEILENLKRKIEKNNYKIKLAIILIGNDDASLIYIKNKEKACQKIGMETILYKLEETAKEEDIILLINKLNKDRTVHGIIIQSPIPTHLDYDKLSNLIDEKKDVDGITEKNIYNLYHKKSGLVSCTPKGILKLLNYYKIDLKGKDVVIVGRGFLVGKPLAILLENNDATVTLCHTKTKNLKKITKTADILISCAGTAKLITKDMVKFGAVVIDVGINRFNGKICGDVDFEKAKSKCKYITPVPGGIGPMTIAMLLENTYEAYERSQNNG